MSYGRADFRRYNSRMQIPFLPLERPLETFGKSLTLTTFRVVGPISGESRGVGSILLEHVVFCGVTRKSPPGIIAAGASALMLIGLFVATESTAVIAGLSSEQTGVGSFLIGLALLLWYVMNRKSFLVINSANGSVCEMKTDIGLSAEEFISQIQTQQFRLLLQNQAPAVTSRAASCS